MGENPEKKNKQQQRQRRRGLTDTLHGAADFGANPEELAQVPARNLHHTVVKTGLEVGGCGVGHRVSGKRIILRKPCQSEKQYILLLLCRVTNLRKGRGIPRPSLAAT